MCSILEDETNKNQFADEFFISCIEEVRQLKHTRKKNKIQVSVGSNIIPAMLLL